jgi:outer membrane protein TolC
MKNPITLLFVLLVFQSQAQILTIEVCQDSAQKNYPLILQYDLIEQSKALTVSNANKAWLPQFDITLIGGILEGMPSFAPPGTEESSGVNTQLIAVGQLNQVIWDGGMTKASKQIIEAGSEIEKAELQVELYQIRERVNNLYFGVLLIDEQLTQLDLLEETLLRNQKRIQSAIANGTAFKSDEDELKVELINVNQRRVELQYNRQAYLQVLSLMIGEEISEDATLRRPVFETAVAGLKVNRPELQMFNSQRSLVDAQSKLNKATLIPKFGLLGFGVFLTPGVDFGNSKLENLYVAGLSLSWQLGPLYKNGNNKKLTEISLQRIQNQEETFLFNTKLDLSQTHIELDKLKKILQQDQEIVALKRNIKNAYVTKYENGVATMSQMLDRINDESLAKQNMIMHEIQYLMKAYQYLNKSGN